MNYIFSKLWPIYNYYKNRKYEKKLNFKMLQYRSIANKNINKSQ